MTTFDRVIPMRTLAEEPTGDQNSEQMLRQDLAAAYRIFDHLGWTTLIFGHITVRVPGPEKHFLINPFGLRYDEVTASNLVKIDLTGKIVEPSTHPVNPAGFIIHSAVHDAREDIACVMHIHTVAASAVAAMAEPMPWIDFMGAGFYDRLSYHDFQGVHNDDSDRVPLVNDLGKNNAMILRNHGLLTCGKTVAGAFNRMFALEGACRAQVAARSMNGPLLRIPNDVAKTHADVLESSMEHDLGFRALYRLMERNDPSFLN